MPFVRRAPSTLMAGAVASLLWLASPVAAQPSSRIQSSILPITASAHGMTYGEWSAAWWQWALEKTTAQSPLFDTTGANCSVGQSGHVWFLAGTIFLDANQAGTYTRNCTVPTGTMLFFPVANGFCSAEGTFAQMRVCATASLAGVTNLTAEIDGVSITNVTQYRALSPSFDLNLPADNVFGAPAGLYSPSAADGYYLMVKPLTPGVHTIHFTAQIPGFPLLDVNYTITVA